MLDHIYEVDSVRQFLLESGARRLDAEDPLLPEHLTSKPGENWLLPVEWKHADKIVVRMGETYPDDPPSLFLCPTKENREILPHISQTGHICTMIDDQVINPDAPREVLIACLNTAKEKILDRQWTDAEITSEINEELTAYWSHSSEFGLLYKRSDLDGEVLEIANPGRNKLSDVYPLPPGKFKPPIRLGMVAELEASQTLDFLRAPGAYLSTSRSFRTILEGFCEKVFDRARSHKNIDIFVFLIVKLQNEECVLAGVVPQGINSKGKNAAGLCQAITGVLVNKGLRPCSAEDVSTKRLLRRTMGPHFNKEILNRRVAIIGCGSLGSMVADGLARCGVRAFFFCDAESFKAENLLRHHLSKTSLGYTKVSALKVSIQSRVPDAEVEVCSADIRTRSAIADLTKFNPDLMFFATGDTNTDMTMSRILPTVCPAPLVFGWAEQDLISGHLVHQPGGRASILRELHSEKSGRYIFSIAETLSTHRESGCQSSYSPYSGLAMEHFATQVAMKLIDWLGQPEGDHAVLRISPQTAWERVR